MVNFPCQMVDSISLSLCLSSISFCLCTGVKTSIANQLAIIQSAAEEQVSVCVRISKVCVCVCLATS